MQNNKAPAGGNWWNGFGSSDSGLDSWVRAMVVYNGELIVGGNFTNAGGQVVNSIARWDGTAWKPLGSGLAGCVASGACIPEVHALAVYNNELIVGGTFQQAGGVAVSNLARWDGSQWGALGPGVNRSVWSLAAYNGELIVGGVFDSAGTQRANSIARWNGNEWHAFGSGMTGDSKNKPTSVTVLTEYKGALIAGGRFDFADGVAAQSVARWDGTAWSPLGSGMGGPASPVVYAFAEYQGDLITGGHFTSAGSVSAKYVAGWNGSAWKALGSGMNADPKALILYNGDIVCAGLFTLADGKTVSHIARWNGTGWSPMDSGLDERANALAVYESGLFVGGNFLTAGQTPSLRVARWDDTLTAPR